jgi:hypothetical protein
MKIPIFVSCPTSLNATQEMSRIALMQFLDEFNLEPRALGRSDYPAEFPLREVLVIAQHCAGGIILGFEQFHATAGIAKRGLGKTKGEKELGKGESIALPTPWNNLEAGILFGLNLPLLIFKEPTISGGVFDNGVTDVFIHRMPKGRISGPDHESLKQVFLKWYGRVSTFYYGIVPK